MFIAIWRVYLQYNLYSSTKPSFRERETINFVANSILWPPVYSTYLVPSFSQLCTIHKFPNRPQKKPRIESNTSTQARLCSVTFSFGRSYTYSMNGLVGKLFCSEREGWQIPCKSLQVMFFACSSDRSSAHDNQAGCRTQKHPISNAPPDSIEGPLSAAKMVHTHPYPCRDHGSQGWMGRGLMDWAHLAQAPLRIAPSQEETSLHDRGPTERRVTRYLGTLSLRRSTSGSTSVPLWSYNL